MISNWENITSIKYGPMEIKKVFLGTNLLWEKITIMFTYLITNYISTSGTLHFTETNLDSGDAFNWDITTNTLTVDKEFENGN